MRLLPLIAGQEPARSREPVWEGYYGLADRSFGARPTVDPRAPFERARVELELKAVAVQSMSSIKVVQPRGCL